MDSRAQFLQEALAAAKQGLKAGHRYNPIIAAAQAALESNWGRSQLARRANNLKGVKAGRSWDGPTITLPTREFLNNQWVTVDAKWRMYIDWAHAFADYGRLIERVYPQAAAVASNARAFLEALVSGQLKYATDPDYVAKVWRIVEQYSTVFSNAAWRIVEQKDAVLPALRLAEGNRAKDVVLNKVKHNQNLEENLIILYDVEQVEVARVPVPPDATVLIRADGKRTHVRPDRR